MAKTYKWIILCLIISLVAHISSLQAKSISLPQDLIIEAFRKDPPGAVLLWVERSSLIIKLFYADSEQYLGRLVPLKWSPDAQKLAVYRIITSDPTDLFREIR